MYIQYREGDRENAQEKEREQGVGKRKRERERNNEMGGAEKKSSWQFCFNGQMWHFQVQQHQ